MGLDAPGDSRYPACMLNGHSLGRLCARSGIRMRTCVAALSLACLAAGLAGCAGAKGDACQVDSDCDGALVCANLQRGRGVCASRDDQDTQATSGSGG